MRVSAVSAHSHTVLQVSPLASFSLSFSHLKKVNGGVDNLALFFTIVFS